MRTVNVRLREVVEAKDTENAVLRAQLGQLKEPRAEVEALRARLGQNSRNSPRPPSIEGLARPPPKSLRKKSGRKPSRPKGQPGATLEPTARPDGVIAHEPGGCCGYRSCASTTPSQDEQVLDRSIRLHAIRDRSPPMQRAPDRDVHYDYISSN